MERDYKTRLEEIELLYSKGRTEDALDLLDNMNWRKVHNVNALVKASNIYEKAGRDQDAKDLLILAHERSPIGRTILFHLAMLCIKTGELEEAREYYDEFVEIAPHDSQKYVIKYRLNQAKGADIFTLISILEELRENDFDEKWAYELATLYHKAQQADKCIELCDEISIYFGEGPYVERALELKMLYHPLNKDQEEKYRTFQLKRDGLTEIRANEMLGSGEIVNHTITIPEVELPQERFNTVNLQAEIKKNIEEIMQATEEGEVSENMEAIKDLVNDIPYLQVEESKDDEVKRHAKRKEELDKSLKNSFQEFLSEEYDGQLSLYLPDDTTKEVQIQGQMTIEDVMENWERTKRAAEAAIQAAEEQKLENVKQEAIKEATAIMDRLEGIAPKLDAGVAPSEIMKDDIMSREPEPVAEPESEPETEPETEVEPEEVPEEVPIEVSDAEEPETEEEPETDPEKEALLKQKTFRIPKIKPEGVATGEGFDIPVVAPKPVPTPWTPPVLKEEAAEEEAASSEEPAAEETSSAEEPEIVLPEGLRPLEEPRAEEPVPKEEPEPESEERATVADLANTADLEEASKVIASMNDALQKEIDKLMEPEEEEEEPKAAPAEPEKSIEEIKRETETEEAERAADIKEGEEMAKEAEDDEIAPFTLTPDERELFSYFLPISGMERAICQTIAGTMHRLSVGKNSGAGNIMIQGGRGSGKSTMAASIIKVLQRECGKPSNRVGKIDGDRLNEKDIQALYDKIQGGCLIIENAGAINRDTAISLSLLMDADTSGVLVILEDTRVGLDKLKSENPTFAKKFTEKVAIPIFSADQLVTFARTYAVEEGYVIDDMGVLALYDRISMIQRLDRPTYLTEVKEIVDGAIEKAEAGGLRGFFGRLGARKEDENGNLILMEKDFQS